MSSAADYRQFAADCLRLAEATANPDSKALLLQLAQGWVNLAVADELASGQIATSTFSTVTLEPP